MAYQMVATAVTLNDLEGHSKFAGIFKCNASNICAAFYTISLPVCSCSLSALAELLVCNRYLWRGLTQGNEIWQDGRSGWIAGQFPFW